MNQDEVTLQCTKNFMNFFPSGLALLSPQGEAEQEENDDDEIGIEMPSLREMTPEPATVRPICTRFMSLHCRSSAPV